MSVVFVINPGAASKKYALFVAGRVVLRGIYEKTASGYQATIKTGEQKEQHEVVDENSYNDSFELFAKQVQILLRDQQLSLAAIGVRVLASGSFFQKHQRVDEVFLSLLREKEPTAPLHIPVTLREIQQCKTVFPGAPVIAVSDTALFSTLPAIAREYSINPKDAKEYDIHRFGYHGLSVASVIHRIHAVLGKDPERMIVCHLGNGMSVSGVKNGSPVYSSAGYSSLNTLPMITRGGDIDVGVSLELQRLRHGKHTEINHSLHYEGGLKALTKTDDVRIVLDKKAQGDGDAIFALEYITYEIQKAIAAATVATEGVDVLVLTGTIGQRSPEFRRLVIEGLGHFGLDIEEDKNNLFLGREGVISPSRSMAKVVVMCTDEMREISQSALRQVELGT